MSSLSDDIENRITQARNSLIEAEAKLHQIELVSSLAKIKSNELVLMVQESKIAVKRSREILDKLKDL
jgi:hypothetical protein